MPSLVVARAHAAAYGGVFLLNTEYADLMKTIDNFRPPFTPPREELDPIAPSQALVIANPQPHVPAPPPDTPQRAARQLHP